MTDSSPDLDRIQRWMQAVITHPQGVAAGIESDGAQQQIDLEAREVDRVIARSRALDSIQRLEIYGNAYYARLIECLAAEYPATRAAAGEEAFHHLVVEYLQRHPSTSYTLGELGRRFPQFLAETRPPRTSDDPDWADVLVDLSTLEHTYSEVFDGPGEEHLHLLSSDQLEAIPADRWADVRFQMAQSLRLLQLRFPVHEYASAVRHGLRPPLPVASNTRLVISRRDFIVRRRAVSEVPFRLLEQLQQGETLGSAIESALRSGMTGRDWSAHLRDWFRAWTQDGYFVQVEI